MIIIRKNKTRKLKSYHIGNIFRITMINKCCSNLVSRSNLSINDGILKGFSKWKN